MFRRGAQRKLHAAAAATGCQAVTNADGEFVLRLEYGAGSIYNPATEKYDRVHLRTYNGCITAPTIDAKQGETLRILVDNALPKNAPACDNMDPRIGCWNTTNLHTHGLHVSPSGHADNVMITVQPGERRPTVIPITADHPAGTFWYHPHAHGSTSIQTTSGMEGVLIIRGNRKYSRPGAEADIDTILHDRDASGKPTPFQERVMMMQQISYACFTDTTYSTIITTDGKPGSPWACPGDHGTPGVVENFQKQLFDKSAWQKSGRFTTIDGMVQPTLTAQAGRIERWRLVHGGVSDTIQMKIVKAIGSSTTVKALSHERGTPAAQLGDVNDKCGSEVVPQYEIALDGLTRRRIQEIAAKPGLSPSNVLQSGYRSDVLVVFPSVGTYCVIDENRPDVADISTGRTGVPRTRRLLAIVEVPAGNSVTPSLDYIGKQLADANPDLPADVRTSLERATSHPGRRSRTIWYRARPTRHGRLRPCRCRTGP